LLDELGAPVADPRNPEQIASALVRALTETVARRREANWQPWGHPAVTSKYEVKNVAAAFRRILHDIVQQKHPCVMSTQY
jgi:hypothetical protein